MPDAKPPLGRDFDEAGALQSILEGTATETGERFFYALVEHLAKALGTMGAWVTEYDEPAGRLRSLACLMNGEWIDYEYQIAGTPCEGTILDKCQVHVPQDVKELFPNDPDLEKYGAVSYLGAPFLDEHDNVLGHLAVMDSKPMPDEPRGQALFRIFAARAGAELRRIRADRQLHVSEEELGRQTTTNEYLQQEIRALQGFDEILGESPAILATLDEVQQVAPTDTTVLILGETGTGKELIARAIHDRCGRSGPLVKVNCAAVPATLIESEFFGHERGAFTGATAKRDGRFALADGGTIFLDEVSEIPIELQGKLLRVLQEGEFEPVGSSRTRSVNVRVLAATNRELKKAVEMGAFREDLYYRLNVFPIRVPPLRERPGDVGLLAQVFSRKISQRMKRPLAPLDDACLKQLAAYDWPGNVRELQNVIELGVITARDGQLNLDRALPRDRTSGTPSAKREDDGKPARVRTMQELVELERRNIELALEQCGGRVSGDRGAARLLGMPPSTLSSRMKVLGIKRRARSS